MSTSPVSSSSGLFFSAPAQSLVQNKDELTRILKIVLPIVVALGALLLLPTLVSIPITLAIGFGAGYLHQKNPGPTTAPPKTENPSGSPLSPAPLNTKSTTDPSSVLPPSAPIPAPANKELRPLPDARVFELLTQSTISDDTIYIPCDKDKAKALVKYLKKTKIVDGLATYQRLKDGDAYSVYITAKKASLFGKSPTPVNILAHLQDVVSSKLQ